MVAPIFIAILTISLQNLIVFLTLQETCAKLTGEYLHLRAKTFVAICLVRLSASTLRPDSSKTFHCNWYSL
jgi:Na+-driven multidrug efflux pump